MKRLLWMIFVMSPALLFGQSRDSLMLHRMFSKIITEGSCYRNLYDLTKNIGHRLSGSPQAEKAVLWAKHVLEETGADSVWLQPVNVPRWVRGEESLQIAFTGDDLTSVPMLSIGNMTGTDGKPLRAQVIRVPDFQAFDKLSRDAVEGKIVFFDYHFRQDLVHTFDGYADAVGYRWNSANVASEKGAVAVIVRSASTALDDVPHTGAAGYKKGVRQIPAVAIGNLSADRLAAACAAGQPDAVLTADCGFRDTVRSYNVIASLKGAEFPDQIILAGAHLDSWDVGEGAHDDGAGIVQIIQVLETFKKLGIRPRHTIRIVCFMNEENGNRGGETYAAVAKSQGEKHLFAIESDAGGYAPRGIGLQMPDSLKHKVRAWKPLFLPYGVYDFTREEGGVDIGPLGRQEVPLAGLLPDAQRYFDLHHSRNDVFEAVNHRELKLGAWTLAALVYLVDQHW